MARNEEKALTLFNKWQTFKHDFHSSASNRRPLLASDCDSLNDAEKWRRELMRDVTKKISAIHNASLGEHRIRELNDEINKMMRQKHYWEVRIRELGGDSGKSRQQYFDVEGKELPGAPGYKYYGAAKDLPGVRELFAEKDDEIELRKQKRSRADLFRHVSPDYYGYRDDDDGVLAPKEHLREGELVAAAHQKHVEECRRTLELRLASSAFGRSLGDTSLLSDSSGDEEEQRNAVWSGIESQNKGIGLQREDLSSGSLLIPSQGEMDNLLMEQKKILLMEKMQLL